MSAAWLLIRASGTENLLRHYAEAPSREQDGVETSCGNINWDTVALCQNQGCAFEPLHGLTGPQQVQILAPEGTPHGCPQGYSKQSCVNQYIVDTRLYEYIDWSKCSGSNPSGCPQWTGEGYILPLTREGIGFLETNPLFHQGYQGFFHDLTVGMSLLSKNDFCSYPGPGMPRSMQATVNFSSRMAWVDTDRFDPYTLFGAFGHFFVEVLPWLVGW